MCLLPGINCALCSLKRAVCVCVCVRGQVTDRHTHTRVRCKGRWWSCSEGSPKGTHRLRDGARYRERVEAIAVLIIGVGRSLAKSLSLSLARVEHISPENVCVQIDSFVSETFRSRLLAHSLTLSVFRLVLQKSLSLSRPCGGRAAERSVGLIRGAR